MQTFTKEERLTGSKAIEELVTSGSSFFLHPFKVIYKVFPSGDGHLPPARLAIAVPKRKFKKAHDRNRVKRLIRESYRKNKSQLFYSEIMQLSVSCNVLLVYLGNEVLNYSEIEKRIILTLQRLISEIKKPN